MRVAAPSQALCGPPGPYGGDRAALCREPDPGLVKTLGQRLRPLQELRVWRFGLYYFFVFGSFVALSQWLIPYYVNVYSLSIVSAGMMTTAFNLFTGLLRIVGGVLSDKVGARMVLYRVFGVSLVGLLFLLPPRVELQTPGRGSWLPGPGSWRPSPARRSSLPTRRTLPTGAHTRCSPPSTRTSGSVFIPMAKDSSRCPPRPSGRSRKWAWAIA